MKYAIAAGHSLTAEAAVEILKAGGNAVDAAIAAFLVSWVAEPCMTGGGGGAFACLYTPTGQSFLFDFFCQTPLKKRPVEEVEFFPVEVHFTDFTEIFHVGKGSSAVPGNVAGVFALHEHFGSLPMKELVQPAIEHAKNGVVVNEFQRLDLELLRNILELDERAKEIFFAKGELVKVGETTHLPRLADFLDCLSREGRDLFYKGEIAQKIAADYQASNGGYLTLADFENYEVIVRKPLTFNYKGNTILTNSLPSIGGSLIVLGLAHLGKLPVPTRHLSEQHFKQLLAVLGKFDRQSRHVEDLFSALKDLFNFPANNQNGASQKRGSTTHFNILDQWGNAVALTSSLGEGCGYFVESADIHLNNMLGESALLPNGFHSWQINVRLSSMMAPTMVLDEEKQLKAVMGSGGASRIPSAILQVLHYLLDYNLPVKEAVNAPRVHVEHGIFNVEKGFQKPPSFPSIGNTMKEWSSKSLFFGGVHAIVRENDSLTTAGDERRDGVVRVGG